MPNDFSHHVDYAPGTRNNLKHNDNDNERELMFRADSQEYGQQVEVMCFDGETRIAHIGGKMLEQVAIERGDIILLALQNSREDTPAQVILKYTADETLRMRERGEFPGNARFNDPEPEFDETFEFGDDADVNIDEI
ncbi:hypothetical protein K438DRAFT_1921588 [Mycena galopus ATCC 62051]|nr:hypothetical protein K438DRAFT_1921588 [Mycena galopus ATCC 62051]